jgi:hypothetical protein
MIAGVMNCHKGNSLIDWIIKIKSNPIVHISFTYFSKKSNAIVIGEMVGSGFRKTENIDKFYLDNGKNIVAMAKPIYAGVIDDFNEYMNIMEFINPGYGWFNYPSYLWSRLVGPDARAVPVCSTIYALAWSWAGIELCPGIDNRVITPDMLYDQIGKTMKAI